MGNNGSVGGLFIVLDDAEDNSVDIDDSSGIGELLDGAEDE